MLGNVSTVPLAVAVTTPTSPFKPGDIMIGSNINGMFLSIFVIGSTGAGIGPSSINWIIYKLRAGQTAPNPIVTGTSELRNQIFHEEKGLSGSADGTPMAFKGVIAIPRSFRRMREGDQIQVRLSLSAAATGDANFCLKAIYNSYQ